MNPRQANASATDEAPTCHHSASLFNSPTREAPCNLPLKPTSPHATITKARLTQAHLKLTAGWGHAGKGSVTMPGKGKTEGRLFTTVERPALDEETLDVYLNAGCYWKNVPRPAWEFTLGGYQILKNGYRIENWNYWVGRYPPMNHWNSAAARRIAVLVLLRPKLDENYRACVDQYIEKPPDIEKPPG